MKYYMLLFALSCALMACSPRTTGHMPNPLPVHYTETVTPKPLVNLEILPDSIHGEDVNGHWEGVYFPKDHVYRLSRYRNTSNGVDTATVEFLVDRHAVNQDNGLVSLWLEATNIGVFDQQGGLKICEDCLHEANIILAFRECTERTKDVCACLEENPGARDLIQWDGIANRPPCDTLRPQTYGND